MIYFIKLLQIFFSINKNSVILINAPLSFANRFSNYLSYYFKMLSKIKNCKIIISIIDIDTYRSEGDQFKREWHIIDIGHYFIVHSHEMKKILTDRGHSEKNIKIIEIYDYFSVGKNIIKKNIHKEWNKSIVFAGNLSVNKSGFIKGLDNMESDLIFRLYGNPPIKNTIKIEYIGSFHPEVLIEKLDGGFGLIWDGDRIDTCSGPFGEYLKINNPHKTSLYLAAGIPVIIWKEAAMASFIDKSKLGFSVSALTEIENVLNEMTVDEYMQMKTNATIIAEKLNNGCFFRKALSEVFSAIK
jgi:hypothetical protein